MIMKVSTVDISRALQQIKCLADNPQIKEPGVMFDIKVDKLWICFADQKHSIVSIIDIIPDENFKNEKVIVSFNRLQQIVNMCSSNSGIYSEEMTFDFEEEKKRIRIKADKFMVVQSAIINESGEMEYIEKAKKVSVIDQYINYSGATESIRYGVITRMDYAGIFKVDTDSCDEWDKEELREVLGELASYKDQVVYLSAKEMAAFTYKNYAKYIPLEFDIRNGFSIDTMLAKGLSDILSKLDPMDNELYLYRDDVYVSIFSSSCRVGIWFEMRRPQRNTMEIVSGLNNMSYDTQEFVFSTAAFKDLIKSVSDTTKVDTFSIEFIQEDDGICAVLKSSNSNAALLGDFKIMPEQQKSLDFTTLENFTIPISLKYLNEMLSGCKGDYVAIDVLERETDKVLRIGDIKGRDEEGEKIFRSMCYITVGRKM